MPVRRPPAPTKPAAARRAGAHRQEDPAGSDWPAPARCVAGVRQPVAGPTPRPAPGRANAQGRGCAATARIAPVRPAGAGWSASDPAPARAWAAVPATGAVAGASVVSSRWWAVRRSHALARPALAGPVHGPVAADAGCRCAAAVPGNARRPPCRCSLQPRSGGSAMGRVPGRPARSCRRWTSLRSVLPEPPAIHPVVDLMRGIGRHGRFCSAGRPSVGDRHLYQVVVGAGRRLAAHRRTLP